MPVDVSVLLPSYNNRDALLLCLEYLGRQSLPANRFEVVVVVDGSTDGSFEALQDLSTPFRLKAVHQPNQGRAAALNRAAAEATGPMLVITDSDILVTPRFVESHLAAHPVADVVTGPIPLSPRSPVNFLTEGVRRWAEEHAAEMQHTPHPTSCSQIYGANISLSAELLGRLGGYRADLRRTEDFQLGKKILAAGCRIVYCPSAVGEQLYDKTFRAWCGDFYVDGVSHARLVEEFPEEKGNLKIGHYHPLSRVKRFLRPRIIHDTPAGRGIQAALIPCLELCRRLGLTWPVLTSFQGVIGDALFWKGVHDEIGDEDRFHALIQPE